MEYKYIAVYCKIHNRSEKADEAKKSVLRKARELYDRLADSYADDNIKILLFGATDTSYLPNDKVEVHYCNDIQDMSKQILNIVKDNEFQSRVYMVLTNWQWRYIEPLLKLKDENLKFFYEGALDPRSRDEINKEREHEKMAKVKIKRGLLGFLDTVGSSVSTDLKG